MISTQRLLLIVFVINLLVGLSYALYTDLNVNPTDSIITTTYGLESNLSQIPNGDLYSATKNVNYQLETTVINSVSMSNIILDTLGKGLNPLSSNPFTYTNIEDIILATILTLFKGLMYALIMLEIFMLFKNKKSS